MNEHLEEKETIPPHKIKANHLEECFACYEKDVLNETYKGKSVLDVGCGPTNTIAKKLIEKGIHWVGLDKIPSEYSVGGNMEKIPFADNSFSSVFCCHSLEHSWNIIRAIQEMRRVVQCGGIIFIATPFHTPEQFFKMDKTHVLIPTQLQMVRLFDLCKIKIIQSYVQKSSSLEYEWNLITIGQVI